MTDGRLDLIETAYRLELDGTDLLYALLDGLGRRFEPRRPLIGTCSALQPDGTIRFTAVATRRDPDDRVLQVMEAAREHATDHDRDRMFYGLPARHSLTSLVSRELHDLADAKGCAEVAGLNCTIGDARALVIAAVRRGRYRPSPGEREFWQPVAGHIAAAVRLRRVLADELPELVVRDDGRVVHAEGEARGAPMRERLRSAMLARERRRSRRAREADPFWPELIAGRWTLVDRFESDGRRYVIAVRNARAGQRLHTLSARQQAVLARVARGEANKAIALDLGVSEATVSRAAAAGMARLGLNLAVIAELEAATRASIRIGSSELALATLPATARDTVTGLADLSAIEREVIALALRGRSNTEIAAARGRSVRTVINQLSNAYAKLGVQSRRELVLRWSHALAA